MYEHGVGFVVTWEAFLLRIPFQVAPQADGNVAQVADRC